MSSELKTIDHYNLSYRLKRFRFHMAFLQQYGIPHRLAAVEAVHHIDRYIQFMELKIVPRKKRSTNTAYDMTWKRVDLTPPEKAEFLAWVKKAEYDLGEMLTALLNDGDRLTVKYNENQNSYYVTIMGTEESHRNSGLGFSSYAKDPLDALLVALYKYVHILAGDMTEAGSQDDGEDFG